MNRQASRRAPSPGKTNLVPQGGASRRSAWDVHGRARRAKKKLFVSSGPANPKAAGTKGGQQAMQSTRRAELRQVRRREVLQDLQQHLPDVRGPALAWLVKVARTRRLLWPFGGGSGTRRATAFRRRVPTQRRNCGFALVRRTARPHDQCVHRPGHSQGAQHHRRTSSPRANASPASTRPRRASEGQPAARRLCRHERTRHFTAGAGTCSNWFPPGRANSG